MNEDWVISILMYDGVEVLDFAGPFEVFTTASRVARKAGARKLQGAERVSNWKVQSVAKGGSPIQARAGLTLTPTHSYSDARACDLLLVPGGVTDAVTQCSPTLDWIRHTCSHAQLVTSVCTGIFVLASAGVVQTSRVTTHWEDLEELRAKWPLLQVQGGVRWVRDGKVWSSAGISAGIDMALSLVANLSCSALAAQTARQMDYLKWTPTSRHFDTGFKLHSV